MQGRPDELRRWIAQRQAAAQRIYEEELDAAAAPAEAIARGLEVIALYQRVHGWPPPQDPIDDHDDLLFHLRWAMLRARVGTRGA
jgi:hypothetical protein